MVSLVISLTRLWHSRALCLLLSSFRFLSNTTFTFPILLIVFISAVPHAKIVYTPMHGVGAHWAKLAFKHFGLPLFIGVQLQMQADPEFPTVKFPNPEEGKGALALSIQTADEHGASFIIANDPDADRMAMAEKGPDGTWKLFTGNETGAILAGANLQILVAAIAFFFFQSNKVSVTFIRKAYVTLITHYTHRVGVA